MYNKIINPETGRKVSIYNKLGKSIINSYLIQLGGSGADIDISNSKDEKRENNIKKIIDEQNKVISEIINSEEKYISDLEDLINNLTKFKKCCNFQLKNIKKIKKRLKYPELMIDIKRILDKNIIDKVIAHLRIMLRLHTEIIEIFKSNVCSPRRLTGSFLVELIHHYIGYTSTYKDILELSSKLYNSASGVKVKKAIDPANQCMFITRSKDVDTQCEYSKKGKCGGYCSIHTKTLLEKLFQYPGNGLLNIKFYKRG